MTTTSDTSTFTREEIEQAIDDGYEMAAAQAGVDVDNDDFVATRAAFWAYLAVTAVTTQPGAPAEQEATYTRDQVSTALNRATDDAAGSGCADDIDNFAVNAAMTLLDNPDADFETITTECYGEDADEVADWLTNAA
ncbi:hypothetical protein AR457_38285 [Streptomyces agglomeratus]|uniref:hypothetical protein n=1 Tax=Streptomyces agglomeratus TaxID=285458 RepID=UPI000854193C|nr:hypothetical protein [Streptomyces agglomeratus]OEJ23047.1 hypothetical protein AR457_38285 [Streptomyces agglomeratus]